MAQLAAAPCQAPADGGRPRVCALRPLGADPPQAVQPDDDAIVATNGVEIKFFLEQNGCDVLRVECTDRYVAKPIDFALNLGPWRHLMFNAFVVARRKS